jgi:hypothetical protein
MDVGLHDWTCSTSAERQWIAEAYVSATMWTPLNPAIMWPSEPEPEPPLRGAPAPAERFRAAVQDAKKSSALESGVVASCRTAIVWVSWRYRVPRRVDVRGDPGCS